MLHLLVFFPHLFFGDRMRSSIKKLWHSATALLQSSAIPFSFLLFPDILGGRARALKKPARAKPFEPRATRRACPRSLVLSSHCRHLMSDAPPDNSSVPVSLRFAPYLPRWRRLAIKHLHLPTISYRDIIPSNLTEVPFGFLSSSSRASCTRTGSRAER